MENIFERLSKINVNDHTEKKNGLTYLSWAWAWAEVKKAFPDAIYKIYENENGWNYFTDGKTCWVKTGVKIGEIENIEYLPIMDFKNKSIALDSITSTDVNKAIQRSLTKACARHGLGLYIYAGEDLPEGEEAQEQKPEQKQDKKPQKKAQAQKEERVSEASAKAKVMAYIRKCGMSEENISKLCESYKVKSVNEMNLQQCNHYINFLKSKGVEI